MEAQRLAAAGILAVVVAAAAAVAADEAHVKQVEAWRARHEADYRREYVPLAGLFFLKTGVNTAGSELDSDIRLPSRAPLSIGRFVYRDGAVRFEPAAGANVMLRGARVSEPVTLRPDEGGGMRDELVMGDIALWVHPSGDRHAIRMRDPQSYAALSFTGFRWFDIAERYRVRGRFIRDAEPRTLKIPSLTGDDQTYTTEGVVEFTLHGQTLRLRPMTTEPGRFFFVFRDLTSGIDTYEAARFLYSDLETDGTTVLDFNMAYNPPCAFNPYTTCPLPLPENRLRVPIAAGERDYRKP
jgi:uncharacterized protein (DUF1684 family)